MNINYFKYISVLLLLFVFVTACEEDVVDSKAPGTVSGITYEATYGGAIIKYKAPNDPDLLYVKASYTNSMGENVFKIASIYQSSIEIDGLNDETVQYPIRLTAIDSHNNESGLANIDVTPLRSYINIVADDMQFEEKLGGVKLSWHNPAKKPVFVYFLYKHGEEVTERIVQSDLENYEVTIRGMESKEYSCSVIVEDFYGNRTEEIVLTESFTPQQEVKIDKGITPDGTITDHTWILQETLSANGNLWEGKTIAFWDDVIDINTNPNDNSYFIIHCNQNNNMGASLKFPIDLVVDLQREVIINRFVVWQRAYHYDSDHTAGWSDLYAYYDPDNLRALDLYTSNDKVTWTKVYENADFGSPATSAESNWRPTPEWNQRAEAGHEFELPTLSEPARYVKFSITRNYSDNNQICGSEITLYGVDDVNK